MASTLARQAKIICEEESYLTLGAWRSLRTLKTVQNFTWTARSICGVEPWRTSLADIGVLLIGTIRKGSLTFSWSYVTLKSKETGGTKWFIFAVEAKRRARETEIFIQKEHLIAGKAGLLIAVLNCTIFTVLDKILTRNANSFDVSVPWDTALTLSWGFTEPTVGREAGDALIQRVDRVDVKVLEAGLARRWIITYLAPWSTTTRDNFFLKFRLYMLWTYYRTYR